MEYLEGETLSERLAKGFNDLLPGEQPQHKRPEPSLDTGKDLVIEGHRHLTVGDRRFPPPGRWSIFFFHSSGVNHSSLSVEFIAEQPLTLCTAYNL
jgi:hypothetical protein